MVSIRHSSSVGGRFFPPPRYCSYSIFNWRMSFSSWFMSSSVVLAIQWTYILMLKGAARTVNAAGGKQCGTDNARGVRPAVQCQRLFEDHQGFVRTGLPGAAACAPMPFGCGLYFYAERFKGIVEPAKIGMLAAVTRRNQLALVQKPQPRLRPGWALVRVRLAGICNTDIEILRGYHDFHGTLGHEFVGEVVRVASVKDKSWVGRRVVGEINIGCAGLGVRRLCGNCRDGIPSHCRRRSVLGIIDHDGA